LADGAAFIGMVGYCTQDELRDEATYEASTEAGEIKFDKLMEKRKAWGQGNEGSGERYRSSNQCSCTTSFVHLRAP